MVEIMSDLHKYVPTTEYRKICSVPCGEESHHEELLDIKCHRILFAGDQLTVKRARSARAQRNNSEDARGRLEGFIPVAQDWHAGLCFMQVLCILYWSFDAHDYISLFFIQVIWKRLFSESVMDKGTLQQLKNLINRTNVPPNPKQNMNGAEDFVQFC